MAKDDEERQAKIIAEQIERGKRLAELKKGSAIPEDNDKEEEEDEKFSKTLFKKENEDQKIAFSFAPKKTVEKGLKLAPFSSIKKEKTENESSETRIDVKPNLKLNVFSKAKPTKNKSALDEIIEEQERWKAKKQKTGKSAKPETWLIPGLVVRVVVKDLGKEYYNKKAIVNKIVDSYGAIIEMIDSGNQVQVDEQHLETVVPSVGSKVQILRGLYRERKGTIVEINEKRESVFVKVDGASSDKLVELTFDDVSKFSSWSFPSLVVQ